MIWRPRRESRKGGIRDWLELRLNVGHSAGTSSLNNVVMDELGVFELEDDIGTVFHDTKKVVVLPEHACLIRRFYL